MRTLTLLVLLAVSACGNAEEEKAKLSAIQKKADERVAQAESQAKTKLADAERELEQVKAQLAEAKSKTEEALSKAQSSAEEQAKAAEAALDKARQAFKEKSRVELNAANKELSDVSGRIAKVPAKSKAAVNKMMQDIVKQQRAVAKDIVEFDKATIDTFRTVNAKVERDLAVLKSKIRAVKAKLPS